MVNNTTKLINSKKRLRKLIEGGTIRPLYLRKPRKKSQVESEKHKQEILSYDQRPLTFGKWFGPILYYLPIFAGVYGRQITLVTLASKLGRDKSNLLKTLRMLEKEGGLKITEGKEKAERPKLVVSLTGAGNSLYEVALFITDNITDPEMLKEDFRGEYKEIREIE